MPNTPILAIPQLTENQSAKEVTINDAILALESAMGKGLIVDYAATTTVTLSAPQLTRNFLLKISGATAACQLVIPDAVAGVATARVFAVSNLSAWDCTVKASSTAPADQVIVPSLQTCLIAADGPAIRLIAKNVPNGAFADMTDVDWTTIGDGKTIIWDASENKFTFITPLTEGSGVPAGGTDGQVLQKLAGVPAWGDIPTPDVRQVPDGGEVFFVLTKTGEGDNDYDWAMLPEGVATPSFLTLSDTPTSYADQGGKVVVVKATADGLEFIDMPVSLPAGGTEGQVLARDAEGAAVWITPAAGGGGGIEDAPEDGNLYARKDGAWESFTTGGGGGGSATVTAVVATSYDLLASDASRYIRFTNTAAKTMTVRPNSVEALPDNGEWHIRNAATGNLTILLGAGVTINVPAGGNLVIPPDGTASLKRTGVDVFDLMGTTGAASGTPYLVASSNLNDLPSKPDARSNLGLGDAATKNVGTAADTVAAGNDTRLSNNYRTSGGVQEILNHTKTLFNSTGTTVIGILPAGQAGDWVTNYRDGAAALSNVISNGNQAGFRAIAYGGLTNNRFVRYGGTVTAPVDIATNDVIGDLNFFGRVASGEVELARIRTEYFGANPAMTNNRATRMRFYVGRDGSTSTAETLRVEYQLLTAFGSIVPSADNTFDLGTGSLRLREIFCANNVINTSDLRMKRDIQPIRDDLLDAWEGVNWSAYRWIDSFLDKGEAARWHFGLIAQHVRDVIDSHFGEGKAVRMGIICHDSWEAQEEIVSPVMAERTVEVPVLDAEGNPVLDENEQPVTQYVLETYATGEVEIVQPAREAGDRWGLRYGECQAIENAFQRRKLARMEARLALLEEAA